MSVKFSWIAISCNIRYHYFSITALYQLPLQVLLLFHHGFQVITPPVLSGCHPHCKNTIIINHQHTRLEHTSLWFGLIHICYIHKASNLIYWLNFNADFICSLNRWHSLCDTLSRFRLMYKEHLTTYLVYIHFAFEHLTSPMPVFGQFL